jgi:hypothetical protein
MALEDDIWTLKSIRHGAGFTHERETLDRVIAILEPLAGLSDEQIERLRCSAEDAADIEHSWPSRSDAHRAIAASLAALRGQR